MYHWSGHWLVFLTCLYLPTSFVSVVFFVLLCSSSQVLWIARNQIGRIGTTLDRNTSLVELNLAENLLGCFKEILNLNRIQSLKKVRRQGGEEMEREGGGER